MQIPLLHQQIILETERLRDLHRTMMIHSSPVPSAEMEALLQQIRTLYSVALQLNNENAIQLLNEVQLAMKPEAQPLEPVKTPEPVIQKTVTPIPTVKEQPEEKTFVQKSFPSVTPQAINGEEKKRAGSDIHEMFNETQTIAGRFTDHESLGEKMAGEGKKRISDNLKVPVKDIKSSIGLNEKFQFINQLFLGDSKKYNAVVDELNNLTSAADAMKFIEKISDENNWESHASTARSFTELIERRFSG